MDDELRLDGNAAAGALQDVFSFEVTAARGWCDGCGAVEPIGALVVYLHAPGVVVRCVHCGAVMIRVVTTPRGSHVDLSGIRRLEVAPARV